ncbi:hypothetical protein LO762_27490 [Actinocorallia sp. API 0066]|uniref:hypothetical protein n=1 Tax=Actinocorallia sp. API 0066 TaxID=2896846 RepID=UPI001E5E6FCE|nr:hypothetical protein [Actinocorallia sp. API 0066]MCD0452896.1 hypothetical protein [Actinocorallia sp. API 0066]
MSSVAVAGALNERNASRFVVAGALAPALPEIRGARLVALPGSVEVHADRSRMPAAASADPSGRSLHLSAGAALFNLRLSAAQVGYSPVVRLLPAAGHPSLLASVRLTGPRRSRPVERLLYAASLQPLPTRQPYGDQHPPLPVLQELAEAARLEGTTLHWLPRSGGPQTAVLTTPANTPTSWLRAGQALQSLLLNATIRSVSLSFVQTPTALPLPPTLTPGETPQLALELARTAR